jgi:hypothetical protein
MTPKVRRRVLLVGPTLLGALGAGSLMVALHVDSWAVSLGAILGAVLAAAQTWLLLGQRADRRSIAANNAATRKTLDKLSSALAGGLVTKRDLDGLERRLVRSSADDEAQLEAYAQLMRLLPPPMPVPRSRGWAASPDLLLTVVDLVLQQRPALVVDVGSGLSTLWEALACQSAGSGRVIAVDHDKDFGAATQALIERQGLGGIADVRYAALTEQRVDDREFSWYDVAVLADVDEIGVLVIDGPPGTTGPLARYPALPLLWGRLAADAVIVLDDADREDERTVVHMWLERYPELKVERLRHEKGAVVLRRGGG